MVSTKFMYVLQNIIVSVLTLISAATNFIILLYIKSLNLSKDNSSKAPFCFLFGNNIV